MDLTALSLFSGAGGLDLGAVQMGVNIRVPPWTRIEIRAPRTARIWPKQMSFIGTSFRWVRRSFLEIGGWSKFDRPDLVLGAPPSGPYSMSGNWLDWKRSGLDARSGLIGVFVKIVTDVKPRFFIIENVPQLASAKSPYRRLFLAMMRRLSNEGYGVSSEVVDASKYGVPQKRKRLMVLGRLDGSAPSIQGPSSAPATT